MNQAATGDSLLSSRARLYPLPPLPPPICQSPSHSARVRQRHKSITILHAVTNRVVHSLNQLYSASTSLPVPAPPSLSPAPLSIASASLASASIPSSASSSIASPPSPHPRQPDNSSQGAAAASVPFPSRLRDHSRIDLASPYPTPHGATPPSKGQQRLLAHIQQQCATFISDVRSVSPSHPTEIACDGLMSDQLLRQF